MAVPEEQRENEPEKIFEKLTAENFPNLPKTINPHIQGVQQTVRRINSKRSIHRCIIVKMPKKF